MRLDSNLAGAASFSACYRVAAVLFRAFCLCQCWLMALVTFANQRRSWARSSTSEVAKNLMLLVAGLPRGFRRPNEINAGRSCGWQFSTHAACSAVSRAGSCPSSDRKRCCSSFIRKHSRAGRTKANRNFSEATRCNSRLPKNRLFRPDLLSKFTQCIE